MSDTPKSVSPAELAAKIQAAKTEKRSGAANAPAKVEENPYAVTFRFPIAPCSFKFPWEKTKRICPDGTLRTTDQREYEHLHAKAVLALCTEVKGGGKEVLREFQTPVPPVQTQQVPVDNS